MAHLFIAHVHLLDFYILRYNFKYSSSLQSKNDGSIWDAIRTVPYIIWSSFKCAALEWQSENLIIVR